MTTTDSRQLGQMKLNELQTKYSEVVGETTGSPYRTSLIRRITKAMNVQDQVAESDKLALPEVEILDAAAELTSTIETIDSAITSEPKLTKLDVPALQDRYQEIIGRPTNYKNCDYLVWKIPEALKGLITVGPRQIQHKAGVNNRVLPLRSAAIGNGHGSGGAA